MPAKKTLGQLELRTHMPPQYTLGWALLVQERSQ